MTWGGGDYEGVDAVKFSMNEEFNLSLFYFPGNNNFDWLGLQWLIGNAFLESGL